MPMENHEAETIREIEGLRTLARWYRDWALLTGSEVERLTRLGVAEHIDAKARALLRELKN